MVRKTSEMVEAGILAAIAVLFAILGTYLPVLGVIFNFLWAVPVAVCGGRVHVPRLHACQNSGI